MKIINNLNRKEQKQDLLVDSCLKPLAELTIRNGWSITEMLCFHNQIISRSGQIKK